jgi:hypothetical protein
MQPFPLQCSPTQARSASATWFCCKPLLIVGLPWIGYATKAGGAHVVLWPLAIPLFLPPLAGTVSRRMPLDGGIYQWGKIGISPFAGV